VPVRTFSNLFSPSNVFPSTGVNDTPSASPILNEKSLASRFPPLSLTTTFLTINVPVFLVLVNVQSTLSPDLSIMLTYSLGVLTIVVSPLVHTNDVT